MNLNFRKKVFSFFAAGILAFSCSVPMSGTINNAIISPIIVSAAPNGGANNVYKKGNDNANSKDKDDMYNTVSDLFGGDYEDLSHDDTGMADIIVTPVEKGIRIVLSVIVGIYMLWSLLQLAIDCIMYRFPVTRPVFTEKCPYQLFSVRMSQLIGVTHVGRNGQGGPGGGGPAPAPQGGPAGGPGSQQPLTFKSYLTRELIEMAFVGIVLTLCVTGVIPKLFYTLMASILGWFRSKGY